MATPVIRVDIAAAMAGLQQIRQDQIPYAASRAINDCADRAVDDLVAWVRSIFFFRGSSSWVKWKWFRSKWSNKSNLVAYVLGMLDYLLLHEMGGIKAPHRAASLAVPLGTLRFKRIPASLRPKYILGSDLQGLLTSASLKGKASRKKQISQFGKAFILELGSKRFIAMRTTQQIGIPASSPRLRGLRLLYFLSPTVKIIPRLKMYETVRNAVAREFNKAFAIRMADAIRTNRR